jgi:hypothetical protein
MSLPKLPCGHSRWAIVALLALAQNSMPISALERGPSSGNKLDLELRLPDSTVLKEMSCRRTKLVIRDIASEQRQLSGNTLGCARMTEAICEK